MANQSRIYEVIQQLRKAGERVCIDSIITQSLFTAGGTLTPSDTNDISNTIWEIKDRIAARVNAKYPDGIAGLAESIAVNAYFNQ